MSGFQSLPVRVFLVAPPLVSWGLERLLASAHPRFELMGTAAGLEEALPLLGRQPIDLVLLDLDGSESAEVMEDLHQRTQAKTLMITASRDQAMLDLAVLAGVRGVLKRNDAPATLLKAIEKVHEGELWIDRHATGRIFMEIARQKAADSSDPEKLRISTLTARERQTIVAVASDASVPAKVIAGRLCISEHTLRNHLTSIYSKLNVSNRLDLYAYATRHRLNKSA